MLSAAVVDKNFESSKIFAIASLEPIEFYRKIEGLDGIINNFYEFDKAIFKINQNMCL